MTSTEPQLNGATNLKALKYVPATLEKPLHSMKCTNMPYTSLPLTYHRPNERIEASVPHSNPSHYIHASINDSTSSTSPRNSSVSTYLSLLYGPHFPNRHNPTPDTLSHALTSDQQQHILPPSRRRRGRRHGRHRRRGGARSRRGRR